MENIFKIVPVPHDNEEHTLDVCVGKNSTQTYSVDNSKLIVKTTQYLLDLKIDEGVTLHQIFPPGTITCTCEEIQALMKTPEWDGFILP